MPLLEAVRLALSQIRAQKLKSFFTLLGVTIGTMFLIAVVSVVNGMGRYVEQDFAAKFLGVLTFNLRRFPDIQNNVTEATWRDGAAKVPDFIASETPSEKNTKTSPGRNASVTSS